MIDQECNQNTMHYEMADRVALIDDDDNLCPYYVEMHIRSIHREPRLDICLFRMQRFHEHRDLSPLPIPWNSS
jgi:hypothetical protein